MPHPGKQARIMIVDDTPENLELLAEILQSRNHHVFQFPNGEMAFRAAENNPPDLFLLDIMMPEMDGFELCKRFKTSEKLRDIPVIFISALDDTENKLHAFSHGGVDYITKPFQEEEVHARVMTHLKLHQAQQQLEQYNQSLEKLVETKVRELLDAQLATNLALSKLTESRDYETGKHIERVQHFCKVLAEQLRENIGFQGIIDDAFVKNIFHASPLHDIGKVAIPDSILLKPGKLTEEEFEIMKTHTTIGANTLQAVQEQYPGNEFIQMGIEIARYHHEKWNGKGYPEGLQGAEIPLSGRISALADVYDALRSNRPYKRGFPHEKACQIILEGNGSHFDPSVVDAFEEVKHRFAAIYQQLQ